MEDAVRMNRREAIARLTAITGTVAVCADLFLTGCRVPDADRRTPFSTPELALLDEIGETIIPATDTPGAKAVGIGQFMATTATACYVDTSYSAFRKGVEKIDSASKKRHGRSFMDSTPAERTSLLNELDAQQRKYTPAQAQAEGPHYFRLMKELTLIGYFTSEIGCTKALRYVEAPGSFDGNLPYKKGDKGFFNPSRRLAFG
jgi:hypothetical protein